MKTSFFLFPLAMIYGIIVYLRNFLYDIQFFKSKKSSILSIVVGNLSMGGSGKTPMILWLYSHLKHQNKIAFLSRGYGRKTKGFLQVTHKSTSDEIGDEPLLLYIKSKNPLTFVCEDRVLGIDTIKRLYPEVTCVLLDDAFQHRKLNADINILLTEYQSPFFKDYYFPVGSLRDSKKEAHRADIMVLTKCPESIDENDKKAIIKGINPSSNQTIFFSEIMYQNLKNAFSGETVNFPKTSIVVSGIANPKLFIDTLKQSTQIITHFNYRDHYAFTLADIHSWLAFPESKSIITTEKDAIRLHKFKKEIQESGLQILILPIEIAMDNIDLFIETLNKKL